MLSQVTTKAIKCLEPRLVREGVVLEGGQDRAEMQNAEQTLQEGIEQGYGHWLGSFVGNKDEGSNPPSATEASNSSTHTQVEQATEPRKRGRPRVNAARNGSAIEKRRAQVRNAQRTYQKRKDEASHTVSQRCDELLQALSDISTAVEELLGSASKAGTLNQKDGIAPQMQQLWDAYDTVINQKSVQPELRLLQIKNSRRQAEHQAKQNYLVNHVSQSTRGRWPMDRGIAVLGDMELTETDTSLSAMSTDRANETTLIQSFTEISSQSKMFGGRSIFDIITQRQAQVRDSDNPTP